MGLGFELFLSPGFVLPAAWFWGSFLNQVADRSPPRKGSSIRWPPAGGVPSLFHPSRSRCFSCGRPLAWHDLLPVISYFLLRGRCRKCGAAIGRRTLVVEMSAPVLLLGWWGAARGWGLSPGEVYGGFGVLSWLLVAGILVRERRGFSRRFVWVGVFLAVGLGILLAGAPGLPRG